MLLKWYCFTFFIGTTFTCLAQDTTDWRLYQKPPKELISQVKKVDSTDYGKTNVIADDRIHELLNRHQTLRDSAGTISGYRIQIFFSSEAGSKTEAKKIKAEFLRKFRKVAAYEIYEPPNFKIRVGDFRTKLEARKALNDIVIQYPNAFIVTDEIELPELKKLTYRE